MSRCLGLSAGWLVLKYQTGVGCGDEIDLSASSDVTGTMRQLGCATEQRDGTCGLDTRGISSREMSSGFRNDHRKLGVCQHAG